MSKILSFLLLVFGFSLQISAQCGGVFFKEINRQSFSHSFSNGYFEDFDGDGLQDLFGYSVARVAQSTPVDFQIRYYKRVSQDSFDTNAKSTLITNADAFMGVIGDVNGDGKKDIVISHLTTPRHLVTYLNDGTGSFSTTTPTTPVNNYEMVSAAGDLNNDGKADLVSYLPGGYHYRLTQADNSFGAPVLLTSSVGFPLSASYMDRFAGEVAIDDLNNDGVRDIAVVSFGNLRVFTNNGGMSFTETALVDSYYAPTIRLRAIDLNNDGKKDFVSNAGGFFGQVRLAVNNGDNTFTASTINLPYDGGNNYDKSVTKEFLNADLDNDGDNDLLYSALGRNVVLRNAGNATFTIQEAKSWLGINAAANLDGDGKADLVTLHIPLINGGYRLNDGNNNFYYGLHSSVSFRKNICASLGQTKIVDFNHDARADRAFWTPASGNWRRYTQNILGSTEHVNYQFGSGALNDVPAPNDFDGDRQTDYAVFRKSTGTWWIARSSDGQFHSLNFGIAEDKPVPADYDGDGKADIANYRPSTGEWHLWLSETSQHRVARFGIAEDKPVPADYDGDGKADVAVFRPSIGTWYVLNSADNSFFAIQYGISTDKPISGDYDADGKANIAVYRDGVWYILRSDFSTTILYWGAPGDEPYFDDGYFPGLGVFRRSNSTVYTTGTPVGLFGISWSVGNATNDIFVSTILPPQ